MFGLHPPNVICKDDICGDGEGCGSTSCITIVHSVSCGWIHWYVCTYSCHLCAGSRRYFYQLPQMWHGSYLHSCSQLCLTVAQLAVDQRANTIYHPPPHCTYSLPPITVSGDPLGVIGHGNTWLKWPWVKVTTVSGFIEQNQKCNYHQSTPSQPPHNPSKFKQLAETLVC